MPDYDAEHEDDYGFTSEELVGFGKAVDTVAEFLDNNAPRWKESMRYEFGENLDEGFNIGDPGACVLWAVYGNYTRGLSTLQYHLPVPGNNWEPAIACYGAERKVIENKWRQVVKEGK